MGSRFMPAFSRKPSTPGGMIIIWSGLQVNVPDKWVHYTHLDDRFPGWIDGEANYGLDTAGKNFRDRGHSHPVNDTGTESGHTHDEPAWDTEVSTGGAGSGIGQAPSLQNHQHHVPSCTLANSHSHYHQHQDTQLNSDVQDTRPPFTGLMYIKGPCDAAPVGTIVLYDGPDLNTLATFKPGDVLTTLSADYNVDLDGDIFVDPVDINVDGSSSASVLVMIGTQLVEIYDASDMSHWYFNWLEGPGTGIVYPAGTPVIGPLWQPLNGGLFSPNFVDNVFDFPTVVGAGGLYSPGDTAGAETVTVTTPNHGHDVNTVTVEDEATHYHFSNTNNTSTGAWGYSSINNGRTKQSNTTTPFGTSNVGPDDPATHWHTANSYISVNQTPSFSQDVPRTGAGTPHNHDPNATKTNFLNMVDDFVRPATWHLGLLYKAAAGSGDDIPIGGITYRYELGGMPGTWQQSDGSNGTYNLTDRCVCGASSSADTAIGDTGGSWVLEFNLHTHDPSDTVKEDNETGFGSNYQTNHWHEGDVVSDSAGGTALLFVLLGPGVAQEAQYAGHTHNIHLRTAIAQHNPGTDTDIKGMNHLHTCSGEYSSEEDLSAGDNIPPIVGLYFVERMS